MSRGGGRLARSYSGARARSPREGRRWLGTGRRAGLGVRNARECGAEPSKPQSQELSGPPMPGCGRSLGRARRSTWTKSLGARTHWDNSPGTPRGGPEPRPARPARSLPPQSPPGRHPRAGPVDPRCPGPLLLHSLRCLSGSSHARDRIGDSVADASKPCLHGSDPLTPYRGRAGARSPKASAESRTRWDHCISRTVTSSTSSALPHHMAAVARKSSAAGGAQSRRMRISPLVSAA